MNQKNGIYKCEVCGNIVQLITVGAGELVCCGQPMNLLEEKTEDEGREKHVPVIENTEKGVKIKVGSVPHPMESEHYIELIEVLGDGQVIASYHPSPGEKPEAEFHLSSTEGITARILCNIHGLWKSA